MQEVYRLLIINPGSTSTKIGIFDNEKPVMETTIRHTNEELAPYATVIDQLEFRKNVILETLNTNGIQHHEAKRCSWPWRIVQTYGRWNLSCK